MAIHLWVAATGTVLALGNASGGLQLTGYIDLVQVPHERLALLHRLNGALTLALFVIFAYLTTIGGPATGIELGILALGLVAYGGKVVVVSVLNRAYSLGGVFGILILLTWIAALWTALV